MFLGFPYLIYGIDSRICSLLCARAYLRTSRRLWLHGGRLQPDDILASLTSKFTLDSCASRQFCRSIRSRDFRTKVTVSSEMRLLEYRPDGEFAVTENLPDNEDLEYAILSHTWGSEEVIFKDLVDGTGGDKDGYEKLRFCANRARHNGLRYFWVDTCCIDKSNQVELNEAIISMFRWYRNAARCYVYLSDVLSRKRKRKRKQSEPWEGAFRESRWFKRGWTLQELLAPASVEFFTLESQRLGDKRSLEQPIYEITKIAMSALRGTDLSQFDADERFKWAESRETTREEDWAYC